LYLIKFITQFFQQKAKAYIIFAPQFKYLNMKKMLGLLVAVTFSIISAQAQDDGEQAKKVMKPSRDFLMFQLTYEGWNNAPDSVKTGGIGRGANIYLCYDFPIATSHFSFAAGLGIGTSNIYFKKQRVIMNTASNSITFQDMTDTEQQSYKKVKLNTAYLEAPFELRYFANKLNRNRGFKAAIGMRVGMLVGAHTKEKHAVGNVNIVEKVNTKRYIQSWRFAPTLRLGYGNFSVYGSYNISQLFNAGQGPEIFPYSVGICITGL
jgi:hypothetical protein